MISPIYAVVGLCGTGKSEATRILSTKLGFSIVYFGGVVLEEVVRRGLQGTQESERLVREELRREAGMAAIAKHAAPKIRSELERGGPVGIDGLYSYGEYVFLTENLGAPVVVIALHASKRVRYQRMGERQVRPLTPAQVDARDLSEIEHLDKARPIALAEHHFVNDGALDQMENFLTRIVAG